MKVHVTPDTSTLTKEHAAGGKVGIGVQTQKKVEEKQEELAKVQRSAKTIDKPEANDLGVNLQFAVDEDTGEHLIKVLDPETGDVLRQFPPEEFLHMVKNLRNLKGMLFSAKV
jgi:flagellar protein FlaG